MDTQIEIYQGSDGQTQIEVKFDQETVWLNQRQIAALFGKDSDTIGLHLRNIFKEQELEENLTTENSSVVQQEFFSLRKECVCFHLDEISLSNQGCLHQGIRRLNPSKALPMGSRDGFPIRLSLHKNPRAHHVLQTASKRTNGSFDLVDDEMHLCGRIISSHLD
jgi:hypothetical protein